MDKTPDDLPSAQIEPEPYGQAALLLVESLIHGLIARSALTVAEAVEIVEVAAEVKQDAADDAGNVSAALQSALHLLTRIKSSLEHDLPQQP